MEPGLPGALPGHGKHGDDRISDSVTVRTGFRSIHATTADGFTINGERLPVHGVTVYHDNAISGGAFIAQDYDSDLRQIHDLGANPCARP